MWHIMAIQNTHAFTRKIVCLWVFGALLTTSAYSQDGQRQLEKPAYAVDRANVPDAIAKVKSGEFALVHVDMIARADAVEAIPILKEQFVRVQDPLAKAKIAAALLRLGEKNDSYWDFLVKQGQLAWESDAPNFMAYDSHGKAIPGPSPEFAAWVKAHNLHPDSAAEDSIYMLPGNVMNLGWSRDSRAIPYLRRALSSPNYMVEIDAALGLAEIGDKDSIPFIIEACKKAPAEVAAVIAESLIYFDSAEAQSAVDKFIPKHLAEMYRDAKAHGQKTPLSPPFRN
jgi:HEAT repeat protein